MRGKSEGSTQGLTRGLNEAAAASERLNGSLRNRPEGGASSSVGATTAAERASHEMNGNLSAEERALNIVKRPVSADTAQNESIARQAGLRGDDVKHFAEVFGDILNDKMADWRASGAERSITGTTQYREGYTSAFNAAVREAASQARRGGSSERATEQGKTVTVNLNVGGRSTAITVADDRSAQALVEALKRAGEEIGRASCRERVSSPV